MMEKCMRQRTYILEYRCLFSIFLILLPTSDYPEEIAARRKLHTCSHKDKDNYSSAKATETGKIVFSSCIPERFLLADFRRLNLFHCLPHLVK